MSKRPVVALVCDTIHPYSRGGREIRYYELTRRLTKRIEFHVYTMNWWGGSRIHRQDGITFHAIIPRIPLYNRRGRRSVTQALLFAIGCLQLLRSDFDILNADHMPYFQIVVLRLVASLKRKPFIVTWHEVWSYTYWRQYMGRSGVIGWALERLAMQLPDHILAVSQHTAERLAKILSHRKAVTLTPHGFDGEAIRNAHPMTENTDLVVVGRLMDHKRVDMLLDAVALLHARGIAVTCRVIGDGPERDSLHTRARNLGIADSVQFLHDVVEQKEIYSFLKSAQIFMGLSAREGFGAAVLEALACGLCVVTTSSPDNLSQYLVARSSTGVICAPTTDDVAAAVQRLLAAQPSQRMQETNTDKDPWLAEYDWDVVAERVAEAYSEAMSKWSFSGTRSENHIRNKADRA